MSMALTLHFANKPFQASVMAPRQQYCGPLKTSFLHLRDSQFHKGFVMAFKLSCILQCNHTYKYDGLYLRCNDCFQWGEKPP